jgi:DNA-binding NarL/FixJ family response regulator
MEHSTHTVRVLLVDDHAIVRNGLRSVLEEYRDIEVVGVAADGYEAVQVADHLKPQVVVMDINMPKMDGIKATANIKARHPGMIVVGISVNAGEEHRKAMVRAGALSLISKEAAVEQLHTAIVEAASQKNTNVM